MEDPPWLYIAMIFIAFVSWVSNRIKEAAEYRRERRAAKAAAERARRTTRPPEYESPYREEPAEPEPSAFEEVYREIERQISEPVEAVTPPPLPNEDGQDGSPLPGAMPEIPVVPVKPTPAMVVRRKKRRKSSSNRDTSSSLLESLRTGNNLKNALILKEVLDKPKALQNRAGISRF